MELDIVFREHRAGARELLVERPERRAPIPGHVARRVEAGPPVSLLLHQAEANQRLKAGHKDAAFAKIVFVVKADLFEGHARSPRPEGEGLAQLLDIVTARFGGSRDDNAPGVKFRCARDKKLRRRVRPGFFVIDATLWLGIDCDPLPARNRGRHRPVVYILKGPGSETDSCSPL